MQFLDYNWAILPHDYGPIGRHAFLPCLAGSICFPINFDQLPCPAVWWNHHHISWRSCVQRNVQKLVSPCFHIGQNSWILISSEQSAIVHMSVLCPFSSWKTFLFAMFTDKPDWWSAPPPLNRYTHLCCRYLLAEPQINTLLHSAVFRILKPKEVCAVMFSNNPFSVKKKEINKLKFSFAFYLTITHPSIQPLYINGERAISSSHWIRGEVHPG